jgi:hypothetical protein
MTEYNFPDREEMSTIEHDPDDPFESQGAKTLFIKYDPEEWSHPQDAVEAVETINCLFGRDVQVVAVDQKIEFMDPDELRELLDEGVMDD